jgi:hypothetical protein
MVAGVNGATVPCFDVSYISNLSTKEKLLINHSVGETVAGAGTAPNRRESVGKWANTSNAVSAVTSVNNQSGDYASGSEVVVLGWDPADTHTSNFWEELASVNLSVQQQIHYLVEHLQQKNIFGFRYTWKIQAV